MNGARLAYDAHMPPIDLGCTVIAPIRWSRLGFVAKFEYTRDGHVRIEEKAFPAHVISATTSGCWTFHGNDGVETVRAGDVLAGLAGQHFGCAHSSLHPNAAVQAVLFDDAIDDDVRAFFKRQIVPAPDVASAITRILDSSDDDEFDSHMFELFHWFSKRSRGQERSSVGSIRMQRAKRFIEKNALEEIGLAHIAQAVALSPFVCVRQFKDATGITPYAYLMHRRIIEAKRLLLKTNDSIENIAKRTGFSDSSYFSRYFKRFTGATPTQYRFA